MNGSSVVSVAAKLSHAASRAMTVPKSDFARTTGAMFMLATFCPGKLGKSGQVATKISGRSPRSINGDTELVVLPLHES